MSYEVLVLKIMSEGSRKNLDLGLETLKLKVLPIQAWLSLLLRRLPAVKKDTIFGAARKFFNPSYFVTALGQYLSQQPRLGNSRGINITLVGHF